jgi:predicted dithiol-disulfide oxidoreductase (DUF899 family)
VSGPADQQLQRGRLDGMALPPVVSADIWNQARDELLIAEKEATRAQDALAARRRRLPMVAFGTYTFTATDGEVTLRDLFGEHDQLMVYQFMDVGPDGLCPGCTHLTNNVTALDALANHGIAWATVSNMPIEQIDRAKAEHDWTMPFYSSRGTSFSDDCGAGGGFMLSAFLRDGDQVYRTYSTTSRGVDRLLFVNNIQDLTAYGRQEDWEDSPEGWPQHPTYG